MIREFRLFLWFIVGVLISFNSVVAFAARNCPPSVVKYISGSQIFDSPSSACEAVVTGYSNIAPYQTSESGYKCAQGFYSDAKAWISKTSLCDDLKAPDNLGMCECPDPCKKWTSMYHNGGSPSGVRLPGGDAGGDRNYYSGTGSSVPVSICIDNCTAAFAGTDDFSVVAGNSWSVSANPIFTGKSCGDSESQGRRTLKSTPEYDCVSAGKAFGYVNNVVTCIKPQAGKDTTNNSKTTSNADGTSTKVDVTKVLNCSADGTCITQTTTTTTTISASGVPGTSYTNQTVEKTSGSSASPSGNTSGNSSFCSDNPQSPLCSSGSFSGVCGSPPACDGDPVQCATAKAVFENNCKTLKPGEPVVSNDPVGERKITTNFGTVTLVGSGSCPADKTAVIAGVTIRFVFTPLCELAAGVRPVVIALGWLVAGFIVFGHGKKSGAS